MVGGRHRNVLDSLQVSAPPGLCPGVQNLRILVHGVIMSPDNEQGFNPKSMPYIVSHSHLAFTVPGG